ncbi:MAG: tol-pal system protein YbgF [Proteobacteria bacterium]|nr:tol-pal system protein YbgF [Pseudomonadota bacterium]
MLNRLHLFVLVGVSVLGTFASTAGWAQAVSVDAASLTKRLESLETRLRAVEGRSSLNTGATTSASPYAVADMENRMAELEREMSQGNGANERMQFAIEKLAKRFDDYTKDMDLRLSDLEAKVTKLQEQPAPPVAAASPAAGPKDVTLSAGSGEATAPAEKKTAEPVPAGLKATDLYNKAYAYLTATDYTNAEAWLSEFLKRYPKDKLADNAWYWLGETQLVQNNPAGAVVSFRNGLQAFPQGAKAPGNLFKMGVALEQLKKPELAKAAWEKLVRDYPKSQEATRAKDKMALAKKAG